MVFILNFKYFLKTFVGLTFYSCFVITEEEITKSRYILITIFPFLIGSIILPFILLVFGLLTPSVKLLVKLIAMTSSVNNLNFFFIIKQMPHNAILKNNGHKIN
ncbi:MAG: DUF3267 domain-containing protein [Bellilinea sp.]